jgi:hypothetical protein
MTYGMPLTDVLGDDWMPSGVKCQRHAAGLFQRLDARVVGGDVLSAIEHHELPIQQSAGSGAADRKLDF